MRGNIGCNGGAGRSGRRTCNPDLGVGKHSEYRVSKLHRRKKRNATHLQLRSILPKPAAGQGQRSTNVLPAWALAVSLCLGQCNVASGSGYHI